MKTTGKLRKYIYGITFFFLVLTGFGQMPVYKRYYISDIPGLDWLSQFYVTHMMHYIASSVLIALVIYIFISFILQGSGRITGSGYLKITIITGLIVSGALMVIRNLSDVFLGHNFIIVLNLIHLGLCMMLMAVSFYTLIKKKSWIK